MVSWQNVGRRLRLGRVCGLGRVHTTNLSISIIAGMSRTVIEVKENRRNEQQEDRVDEVSRLVGGTVRIAACSNAAIISMDATNIDLARASRCIGLRFRIFE